MLKYFSMFSGIGGFELGIERAHRRLSDDGQTDVRVERQGQEKRNGSGKYSSLPERSDGHPINGTHSESNDKGDGFGVSNNELTHRSATTGQTEPDENLRQMRFGETISEMSWNTSRERPTDQQGVQLHDRNRSAPLCVGYSEIDKYAIKVYEKQFKGHTNYGDATTINPSDIPDFDLLVGGFPCQAFSIAGKRQGFNETRGTLFFDIARILAEKRPRYLVLENVKGLLSHDGGKTFQVILGVLTDLGYSIEWQVLNSKNFGVPQNRERVYIAGHLGNGSGGKVFPIQGNDYEDAGVGEREISGTIDTGYAKNHRQSGATYINVVGNLDDNKWSKFNESSRRVYGMDGIAPTIPTSAGGGHTPKIETKGTRIRRLIPIECERLQGFPDDWTKYNPDGSIVSDTQRYKMCGNAVTVNVLQAVVTKMIQV